MYKNYDTEILENVTYVEMDHYTKIGFMVISGDKQVINRKEYNEIINEIQKHFYFTGTSTVNKSIWKKD
jgi:hypothetical protein